MKKKYYAVRCGRVPGIYDTWAQCQKQTTGYSGASFKSFESLDNAKAFLSGESQKEKHECEAMAYTDGSFDKKTSRFSYGVVLFVGGEKKTFSKAFSSPELASMRNVAGEIAGAECAMRYCIDNNIKSLEILYDYEGVEKWCTGEWKTNKSGTIDYKNYYDSVKENLCVTFTKVKGHSGNKYNDEADLLAKNALGILGDPHERK